MWRTVAKFAVKMLLGIAAIVWVVAPVSKWNGFVVFAAATGALLVFGFVLYALEEDESKSAHEEFKKPNY